jgi:phosphoglycolate phosphatase-like HAD superfamily hydrolase
VDVRAVAIELDVLGDTRRLWDDWLADAARRYRSIAELDIDSLPRDRAEAAAQLDKWAAQGIGDWRQALRRFAEDRAPVYLRPEAEIVGSLRALEASGALIGVFTEAPEPLARVALAHLGAARRIDHLETGPKALERLLERLGPDTKIARSRDELSDLHR